MGRTLDLLAVTALKACGEVVVRIHHNLLRKDSHEIGGITKVFAHAQALAQCNDWLGRNLPNAERIAVASNAEAARLVAESDSPNVAAIAGRIAAEIYQLSFAADFVAVFTQQVVMNADNHFAAGFQRGYGQQIQKYGPPSLRSSFLPAPPNNRLGVFQLV